MEQVWSCTRATTKVQFENTIVALEDANEETYDWLAKKTKHKLCKSFFRYNLKFYNYFSCFGLIIELLHVFYRSFSLSELQTNNNYESFNGGIVRVRLEFIFTMLESIRELIRNWWTLRRDLVKKRKYEIENNIWNIFLAKKMGLKITSLSTMVMVYLKFNFK